MKTLKMHFFMSHSLLALAASLVVAIPGSASFCLASDRPRPINVGDLEISGEIRKPMLQYVDSDQANIRLLPKLAREQLTNFEAQLLQPLKVSDISTPRKEISP
ncbi:MAG: hypothetical protein H7222_12155 [Methylotenera sp.]|nr:hypothetical protein [Oligoflexia bacterium]